jgi:hypothetical protein
MAVWAVYGRPAAGGRRYLKSVSVVSAERARALASEDETLTESARSGDLVVRRYGALQAVAWWVDARADGV